MKWLKRTSHFSMSVPIMRLLLPTQQLHVVFCLQFFFIIFSYHTFSSSSFVCIYIEIANVFSSSNGWLCVNPQIFHIIPCERIPFGALKRCASFISLYISTHTRCLFWLYDAIQWENEQRCTLHGQDFQGIRDWHYKYAHLVAAASKTSQKKNHIGFLCASAFDKTTYLIVITIISIHIERKMQRKSIFMEPTKKRKKKPLNQRSSIENNSCTQFYLQVNQNFFSNYTFVRYSCDISFWVGDFFH